MLALEENKIRQLEVKILGLKHKKDEATEAACRMDLTMNRALYQAKLQQKEKCIEVLYQIHPHFNRLLEVSGCKAFHLG